MNDPIAYFITWTTYGTWLPGDERGWYNRDEFVEQLPDQTREERARELLTDDPVILTPEQRIIVDAVIVEHCRLRNWTLHARNVRTNHVHVVVTAALDPKEVREQLKAWASRHLSDAAGLRGGGKNGRRRWWTEKGDIEWVLDDKQLGDVIHYVRDLQ